MRAEKYIKRLKSERNRLNLTQEGLARALGTSRGTIANCEVGRTVLDTELLDLADQIGMDIMYLVTGRRSHSGVNWHLLQVIDACINNLEAEYGKVLIQNRYLLQKLLYEKFAEQKNVDDSEIEAYLRATS